MLPKRAWPPPQPDHNDLVQSLSRGPTHPPSCVVLHFYISASPHNRRFGIDPVLSTQHSKSSALLSISHVLGSLYLTDQATHPRLHVRNAHDAHVVFEATRQGFLRPITRRLDETERSTLVKSGAIFVWQESDDAPGLKRWTDGRVWSQSRMREPYLFYDEQIGDPSEPSPNMQTYRFVDAASKGGTASSAISHQERSTHIHRGLVKQAYSAWVMTHPNSTPRKWHITAYFRYDDLPHIPTVDLDPCLRRIIVPVGLYRDGKARNRSEDSPVPPGRPISTRSRGHTRSPTLPLPSMFAMDVPTLHDHGGRLTEDQRVIRMLNGNFFGK